MNILPLVVTLMIILSILTVEKMDRFKNKVIIQNKYEQQTRDQENSEFNKRQRNLFGRYAKIHHLLTFRPFLDKKIRDANPEKYKQFRQLTIDLIHILYGHTKFYKKMEERRPEFVSELLDAIQISVEEMHANSIKRIDDIARIKLDDPVLQEVFYRMLKGTIGKEESKKPENKELLKSDKAYFPLLTFINYDGMDVKIKLGLAPRELLLAIYGNPDLVQKLIDLRIELTTNINNDKIGKNEARDKFKAEFEGKQKQGITDLFDYAISTTLKEGYE